MWAETTKFGYDYFKDFATCRHTINMLRGVKFNVSTKLFHACATICVQLLPVVLIELFVVKRRELSCKGIEFTHDV